MAVQEKNFNPRSPSGLRHLLQSVICIWCYFNPRSPSGLRPLLLSHGSPSQISIHAARVGCDQRLLFFVNPWGLISIHAARVGCDEVKAMNERLEMYISIHAARVGCDY